MTSTRIEILRELFRVTEYRAGAVYCTEYVRDIWCDIDDQTAPAGHLYAVKSSNYLGETIRRVPTNQSN